MTYDLTISEAREALRQAMERDEFARIDAALLCECGHPKDYHRKIRSAAAASRVCRGLQCPCCGFQQRRDGPG